MASYRTWLWPIFLIVVVLGLALGRGWFFEKANKEIALISPENRIKISAELLTLEGEETSLERVVQKKLKEEKTQRVLISLWATWCPPCLKELPELNKVRSKFMSQGTSLLLLNYDRAFLETDRNKVQEWLNQNGVELSNMFDSKEILLETLNLSALPYNVVINERFEVLWGQEGIIELEEIEKAFHGPQAK